MDSSSDDEARPHESGLALSEDGTAEPYVAQSASGGLGLFARGKPKPIEYRRDPSLPNGGFLSAEQADALWKSQSELSAQYLMEVGLDTQWYRDEVTAGGALRPITHISSYVDYGQRLDWDEETEAMVLVERGHRNIYIPIIDPRANPAAFANDACFGRADPTDDPEKYDCIDEQQNALEQIPCLSRGEDGKLWWSSVWLYPRAEWPWREDTEQEICFAYNWPVEEWMNIEEPNGGGAMAVSITAATEAT